MSTSKHIDKICIVVICVIIVLTIGLMSMSRSGSISEPEQMDYANTIFDTSYVHTIDIVMDDWDSFIKECENEEYSLCAAVVDGTRYDNIAIRAKGNTSLSGVGDLGSDRYSFKLEFDHYVGTESLDGLDKLCLNNMIQDNTMMKDYIVYQLMSDFGVDSPLCSFAYITVNGEDKGLYLAVEGVEESFLSRNYGSESGELYKPDSMSLGGGRGNGKSFNMDELDLGTSDVEGSKVENNGDTGFENRQIEEGDVNQRPVPPRSDGGSQQGEPPERPSKGAPQGEEAAQMPDEGAPQGQPPELPGDEAQQGSDSESADNDTSTPAGLVKPDNKGGANSEDVKLKYIDDNPTSYSNIFENAKTEITSADKKRLIESLKSLSAYTDLEDVVDIDEVLRYFVVHNFVCNGDSYTGAMIHNYYLHEYSGKLSMIPWDYNLAFGTFEGGNASATINKSIDSPVSNGSADDRPMVGWIFSGEEYTAMYHELFTEFTRKWFSNGELASLIQETADMIRPYVEKDPTKFCTTEEFEAGVTALSQFINLRGEAVTRQLAGDLTAVDTGNLNLSDMGTMEKKTTM